MKKLIKYTFFTIIYSYACTLFSQSNKVLYHYKGIAGIGNINISNNGDWCFDRKITGQSQWVGTGFYYDNFRVDAISNNSLTNANKYLINRPNIIFSIQDIPIDDYCRDEISFITSSGFNQNFVAFNVDYNGMNTNVNIDNGIASIQGSFPITTNSVNLFPANVRKYLNASTCVESTNTTIVSHANSITSGCTDLRTAILKLSKWIEANIKMSDKTPNKSLEVFNNKYGDCDGVAHLLAAFCRSQNIPARIVSGYSIDKGFSYPGNKGGTANIQFGSGTGTTMTGHSACEIYIPSISNWVRCDPAQRTVFFGNQNFVKIATGIESTNHLSSGIGPGHLSTTQYPVPRTTSFTLTRSVNVSSSNANYSYVKSESFTGTTQTNNNTFLACAADPTTLVGFNDKVTINDPTQGTTMYDIGQLPNNTYTMTPCTPANFYAKFISETVPETYADSFDWTLILYRSNGVEYVYAQQNGIWPNAYNPNEIGSGCYWQPTLGILPAYDWLYDPSGNIYGKVKVAVHINDGDIKYDETTIGVSSVNNIHDINYSTNTTIDACAELNLTNVSISGTSTITFNTNGLGITINGTFEAPLGSTLIINE